MNAIDMCKDAVELSFRCKKMGHDLMLDISQHVEWVSLRLFMGGWSKKGGEADLIAHVSFGDLPLYNKFKNDVLDMLLEKVRIDFLADQTEQKIKFQNENNN